MKLAIVGGSATSTPSLFMTRDMRELAGRLEVSLIGRSPEKLSAVARAIQLSNGRAAPKVTCATSDAGLTRADVVLLQARYGGYEARARDETFPLKHDACGDEGLGAGGFAAALRSWPEMAKTLAAVRSRCPGATVLLITAPVSLLVRCAHDAFPDVDLVGICELPWATLQTVCDATGAPVASVEFSYAGVNRLGWFDEITWRGVDLVERFAQSRSRGGGFPSADLIAACNAVPLKYLDLHYQAQEVLQRQRAHPARALELNAIARETIRVFASSGCAQILDVLKQQPTPWYADAVAPFIAAIAGKQTHNVFFLSTANERYLPSFSPDEILEQPFVLEGVMRRKLPRSRPLPEALETTLAEFVSYERAAARTVIAGTLAESVNVLAMHPWLRHCRNIDALAADLIAAV
jgi:6-phospho-beta-glucosidase